MEAKSYKKLKFKGKLHTHIYTHVILWQYTLLAHCNQFNYENNNKI